MMGPQIVFSDLLIRISLALGIGLVIGLERGWTQREERPGSRTAGIRTFAVTALLGAIVAALALALVPNSPVAAALILCTGLAVYATAIVLFSREENRAEGTFSATTAIAGIATFALGAYAVIGDMRIAAAAAVSIAALLAFRQRLHGILTQITWTELRSAFVLLAMTFVALPFLPSGPIAALAGVDLRRVWLIAIVLAAVSFAAYLAMKYFGPRRGLLVSAMAGGLVSSTAVTIHHARLSAAQPALAWPLAAGVAIASGMSCLRVLIIVVALNPLLARPLAPPLLAAALIALVGGLLLLRAAPDEKMPLAPATMQNPFAFWPVVGFAVLLGLIGLAGRAIAERFGPQALIAGAALVGLGDVDAISASLANLSLGVAPSGVAALAILVAVASNNLAKLVLGGVLGRGRFVLATGTVAALMVLTGVLAVWLESATGMTVWGR